jgi:hypothetical protein
MGRNEREPRDISRRRMPPSALLRTTRSVPVVIVRGPRAPGVFGYAVDEWVKVVAETTKYPDANLHQLLIDLEAAGQRYQTAQRNLRGSRARRTLRQALILDALQAWAIATGDSALKFSRVWKRPDGPLIRFLGAALDPILGVDMIGYEVLAQTICRARPLRKSG